MFKNISIGCLLLMISLILSAKENAKLYTANFNTIIISKQINVQIINSESCYLLLKDTVNEKDNLEYLVQEESLTLSTKGLFNEMINIEIGCPNFKKIIMSGTGDINTSEKISGESLYLQLEGASAANLSLHYNSLYVRLSGATDANIYGEVDSIYIMCSGASDFNGFDISNIYSSVIAEGACDVKVDPDSTLLADVSGASSIKYVNEPICKKINLGESVSISTNEIDILIEESPNVKNEVNILKENKSIYKRRKKKRFVGNWSGLEFGINGYLTSTGSIDMPEGYEFLELKYEKSTNFNLNFFQQSIPVFSDKVGLVTGMGIQWFNYRFYDNMILTADSGKVGGYYDDTPGRVYSKSKLTVSYVVVPVLLEFQTNSGHGTNSFHVSAGVVGGIRLGSHSKQVYKESSGGKHKPKTYDSFYLQPFKLDATARMGWGPLNFYFNYSIIEMFRNKRGPELYPFSVGIVLPF